MRRLYISVIATLSMTALAACGSSAPAPTTTSTSSPAAATVTSVAVTGPASASASFQLSATARLSDGTSRDVTALAGWESSDITLAIVTSSGAVTIMGSGTVVMKATYQNVSGSMSTTVSKAPPLKFTVSGVVREVDPHPQTIAGARVVVTGGADAGRIAVSDDRGAFTLPNMTAGAVSLDALKDGYLISSPLGFVISADTQQDVFVVPVPPKDSNGVTATARCEDGTWSWAQTRAAACTANGGMAYPVCPGILCPANVK